MKALERKVLRDLRGMWSQALAIVLVVASGIGGFLGTLGAVESLAQARDAFYESTHFADVFATVRRAGTDVAARIAEIPGVTDVQATVQSMARVRIPGSADPVLGQLIGRDSAHAGRLNTLVLRSGRWPQAASRAGHLEAVVSELFAEANHLGAGRCVSALMNGKLRELCITGTVLSPEYVFGGVMGMPDKRAFGVFWVDAGELAAALDLAGAFNHLAIKLAPDAARAEVIEQVTRRLAPYGGAPAYGREQQPSNSMLDNEIREQHVMGTLLPAIFLLVSGFLLHVVSARLIVTQREQVAALKALGYGNGSLVGHYLQLMAPIVLTGFVLGWLLGAWMEHGILSLYSEMFRFPALAPVMPIGLALMGLGLVVATAVLGTLSAIGATVRLAPAEAMRPPAPGRYRRSLLERLPGLVRSPALRMILRNMERHPLRSAVTVGGIAVAVAIVILGNFFRDSIDRIVQTQFGRAMRGDIVVWTAELVDAAAARELARVPGVRLVEAQRRVPVRFINGSRTEVGNIDGQPASSQLQQNIDLAGARQPPGLSGLRMTDRLAEKLALRPGDRLTVEVREGRRQVRQVTLEGTVSDMMGLNATMERDALNRWLGDGDLANAFSISVEPGQLDAVLRATEDRPRVAGAFSKATLLRNMQEISARNVRIISAILTAFAVIIAVGVVYVSARIALAERSWELASLRVLGFTQREVSQLLLGELAIAVALALPLGMGLGWSLAHVMVALLRSDQFAFPVVILPRTYAWAALAVLMAGWASALVVRHQVKRLDMVGALKARD